MDTDLETICLKGLDKDPAKRYSSAAALADDLSRWLSNEPIEARPTSAWNRGKKWVRRRPAIAALSAATLLLLLIVAVVSTVSALRVAASRDELRHNLYVSETSVAFQSFAEGNVGQARYLLERQRPKPGKGDDLRGFEWRYLWGVSRPQELSTNAIGFEAWGVAFSPDRRVLAIGTAGPDGEVILWDYLRKKEIATLTAPGGNAVVDKISFSPDGREMACSYRFSRRVRVWDLQTLQPRLDLTNFSQLVNAVSFSPDGNLLVVVTGPPYASRLPGQVRLFDARTGEVLGDLPGVSSWLSRVEFAPNGQWIAAGGGSGTVLVWDVQQRSVAWRSEGHLGDVMALAFSPDSSALASADTEGLIRLWDVSSGREIITLPGHAKPVYGLSFSPDGRLFASGSMDHTIKLWDAVSFKNLNVYRGHSGRVTAIDFARDGSSLASVSVDGSLRFWNTDQHAPLPLITSHGSLLHVQVDFSGDPHVLAVSTNRQAGPSPGISMVDVANGAGVASFSGDSFVFSADGKQFAARSQREVSLVGLDALQSVKKLIPPANLSPLSLYGDVKHFLAFSSDNRFLAASCPSNCVAIWQLPGGETDSFQAGTNSLPASLMFTPDGRLLLTWGAGDHQINLWTVGNWEHVGTLPGFDFRVAASPDGRTLASSLGDVLCLWDLPMRRKLAEIRGNAGTIWSLAFAPDGRTLAAGTHEGSVKFWNIATQHEITTLQTHISIVSSVAFSRDGRYLATASIDDSVKLWKAPSFDETDKKEPSNQAQ